MTAAARNVDYMHCPACGHALEAPREWFMPDAFKGMRLVEIQLRFICEGCGALLSKNGAPSVLVSR